MRDSEPTIRTRYPAIDVLRGGALAAMVVYHLCWDLAYHGLVTWEVARDPLWRGSAVVIAGSFLLLAGLSLALAAGPGLDARRYLIRLGRIAAGAAAVSIATFLMTPDSWVFFGILHMIAVGSVLALPFLRLPASAALVVAIVALLLPSLVRSTLFDGPLLWWLGLGAVVPHSNDYVPVLPWLAPLLAGVAIGRMLGPAPALLSTAAPRSRLGRGLAKAGRHSLVVYLVHQPLLFGAVAGLALVLPVDRTVEQTRFSTACTAQCVASSGDGPGCQRFCGCVVGALAETRFFSVRGGDPTMDSLVAMAAMNCQAGETPLPAE